MINSNILLKNIYFFTVQCTLYIVQCTLYNLHCTMYTVQCTVYIVQCTLYSVHCVQQTYGGYWISNHMWSFMDGEW